MKKLLTLALAFGMVFSLGFNAFGAPAPVPGNPGWDTKYATATVLEGEPWDRGNANGDKITSNAHSAEFPGCIFTGTTSRKTTEFCWSTHQYSITLRTENSD